MNRMGTVPLLMELMSSWGLRENKQDQNRVNLRRSESDEHVGMRNRGARLGEGVVVDPGVRSGLSEEGVCELRPRGWGGAAWEGLGQRTPGGAETESRMSHNL